MKEIKSVEIVEITDKQTIYKNGEQANAIEVVHFKYDDGSPCGYHLISQKDLYQVGDKAIYIQPDYCVSDIALFDSFTKPNGDPKKSKLGKNSRIRAVKFNFNFDNSSDPIYSFGILLPLTEVESFLHTTIDKVSDLSEVLGIVKYEEPETGSSGMVAGDFPSFMYKTDEENYMNKVGYVKGAIEDGEEFGLTIKRDGCLDADTPLETEDGFKTIKDICDTKYKGLIKSYNVDTDEIEMKQIINHKVQENIHNWYEIELENGKKLKVTGNHYIWVHNLGCYRKVEELDGSEELLVI